MKPTPRHLLGPIVLAASFVPGCGPGHDRQMIYTAPRVSAARVKHRDGARARPPSADNRRPAPGAIAPSNGVDVPAFEPD